MDTISRRYIDKHIKPYHVVEYYEQDDEGFYSMEDYDAPDISISIVMNRADARKLFDNTLKWIKDFSYNCEQYSSVSVSVIHIGNDKYRVIVIDSCDGHSVDAKLEESYDAICQLLI